MVRYIRDHAVYGKVVNVFASSETEARFLSTVDKGDYYAWEATETDRGEWEVYIAKHEDCFALDD